MFNNSKYTNWYYSIIKQARAQPRKKGQGLYFERHHIVPKSVGGDNRKENLVLLTAKEHYICHLLLPKMCRSSIHKSKMVYAFMRLSGIPNQHRKPHAYTGNLYERLKIAYVSAISGENCYMYGVPKTDEIKQKVSQTRKQKGLAKGKNNPMFNKNHTTKSKQKMSENSKGKTAGSRNGMFGKSRPDLSKRNSETNVRYKIGQYDKDGNLIATHEHSAAAANAIGAKAYRNISFLAKNWKKYPNRTVYGFKWRYLLD